MFFVSGFSSSPAVVGRLWWCWCWHGTWCSTSTCLAASFYQWVGAGGDDSVDEAGAAERRNGSGLPVDSLLIEEGMSQNTLTMLGGSWIRSDGIFAQVLGKVPVNFSLFYENTMKLMFWILIGMFRFVSSSFRRGGIPEWQRLLMHGWKFPSRNFPYCPVPCASPWYSSVVKASRWRPPRCWSCDAQQRNSFNYRYTDSSQRTIRLERW